MRWFRSYIQWRMKSVNAHGIHSPFLYDFYTRAIAPSRGDHSLKAVEELRAEMLHSRARVPNIDLGAGSRKNNGSEIEVRRIASVSVKPVREARLLHRIAAFLKPRCILELGTSLGISTLYLADACPHAEIHTIEGNPYIRNLAIQNFEKSGFVNILSHEGNFDEVLPVLLPKMPLPDMVFIDGNHTYEATLRYYGMFAGAPQKPVCIIFDDIYWSEGMQQAWQEICARPEVSLSLDLFHMGIVFFNPDLTKEHYYIRY
ncbi:MAG: O-methyltransferase [Flavobacteriales bacterium]